MAGWNARIGDIQRWYRDTFEHYSPGAMVLKTFGEATEFRDDPSAEEAADILICVIGWAQAAEVDLLKAVTLKMEKNKARRWQLQPDGTYQHIKGT